MRTATRTALALVTLLATGPAAARERAEIPVQYTWKLADLYPTDAAWSAARDQAKERVAALGRHQGHLGGTAAALRAGLDDLFATRLLVERLFAYAMMLSDQDIRESGPQGMRQSADQLTVSLGAATAWIEPEILGLDAARVRAFQAADPGLAPYAFFLDNVLRRKAHTLSAAEERVMAEAGNLTGAGQAVHSVFSNADLPYPTVKLSTGAEARLDVQGYGLHRQSPNREDREKVYSAFFGALKAYQRTFGAALDAQVKGHLFQTKLRGFKSALEWSLFKDNIPPAVYSQLVSDVRQNLPTLRRYLKLRQRILGVEKLRYSDLYVPLVGKVEMAFTPEQAQAITLEAFAPLGPAYLAALQKGYESRWTDYLPTPGKRSGAYSMDGGVYGLHPFQLLNFNGKYDDLSTLAHESGHSMHTWLSITHQPYPTSGYATFVAEVASTLNENLLLHHMLRKARDDATRLALLGSHLESMRTTLFRQTLFAEFERAYHEMAERDEPITGEALSSLYLRLLREYYGHDQGVCQVDDAMASEWGFISHFFDYDFYVYQYATSLVASTSLARAIREESARGATQARDRYLAMLQAGGSRYPVDLLKAAGVDPTTSAPFAAAMAEMNATMDEMEQLLARQKK
jgi:oligoendopeptidase F